jgi:hypothetical protein
MGWLVKLPWKAGELELGEVGTDVWVSATRLEWRRARDLPEISARARALRRRWHERPGTVGVSLAFEPRRLATWSLTVWRDRESFHLFLASPEHARLMKDYLPALANSDSTMWPAADFALNSAWSEARRRLSARPTTQAQR